MCETALPHVAHGVRHAWVAAQVMLMKLLVVYATTDGMTARIAERIGEAARAEGSSVDVLKAPLPYRTPRSSSQGAPECDPAPRPSRAEGLGDMRWKVPPLALRRMRGRDTARGSALNDRL